MTTARRFSSGKEAMTWATAGGYDEPGAEAPKSAKQLDLEIDQALGRLGAAMSKSEREREKIRNFGRGPVLTPTTGKPLPPFPAGRSGVAHASGSGRPFMMDAEPSQLGHLGTRAPRELRGDGRLGTRSTRTTPAPTRVVVAKPEAARKVKSLDAFMASLPPALTRRGPHSVETPVIAKAIRADLAAAIAAGLLPSECKFSITTSHNSINVKLTAWIGAVFSPDYTEHLMAPDDPRSPWGAQQDRGNWRSERLAEPLDRALGIIEKIADRHNYNNSDTQSDYFDVGYYLDVSSEPVQDVAQHALKLESNKGFSKLMQEGHAASLAVGPEATKGICGSRDLASASEYCLARLIKLADIAKGRAVFHDPRRGWIPEDGSREIAAGLPTVQLGKSTYRITSQADGFMYLVGPRGGPSTLNRTLQGKRDKELGVPSSQWIHQASGSDRKTYYMRAADGTFTIYR